MLDKDLLNKVLGLHKKAYAPPSPSGGPPMPPMDPSMMGGMPPMDPAMMGGAPPMDPSMMGGAPPMDPSMMGGAPPMDPSMMGGMPPMDPSMMGGMPPMDPAMMGGAPPMDPSMMGTEGLPITLSSEDLQSLIEAAAENKGGSSKKDSEDSESDLAARVEELEQIVVQLASALGVNAESATAMPSGPDMMMQAPPAEMTGIPQGMPAPEEMVDAGEMPEIDPLAMPQQVQASEEDAALLYALRAMQQYR